MRLRKVIAGGFKKVFSLPGTVGWIRPKAFGFADADIESVSKRKASLRRFAEGGLRFANPPYALLFAVLLVFAAPVHAQDTASGQEESSEQQKKSTEETQTQNKPPDQESGTYTFTFERMATQPEGSKAPQGGEAEHGTAPAESTPPQQETTQPQGPNAPANSNPASAPVETIPVQPTDQAKKEEPAPKPKEEARPEELEKVTVTASKREKTLRDLPASIAVLGGEDLEKRGAQSMADYLKLVPGVSLPQVAADANYPIIRGIATSLVPGFTQATAGTFLGDMPLSDAIFPQSLPDVNPFDLDRVEVLKGPQGTLFGAGALAGAIRFIPREPDPSVWEAKLLATGMSSSPSGRISPFGAGAFNIPLFGDAAAIRAVGLFRKDEGRIDNLQTGVNDVDKLRQATGRVLGAWNPGDRLKLNAMYFRQTTNQYDLSFTDQTKRFERSDSPFATPRDSTFSGANLTANYGFDWASLVSSTNLLRKNNFSQGESSRDIGQGFAGTPNDNGGQGGTGGVGLNNQTATPVLQVSNLTNNKDFSQELRVVSAEGEPWEWLVGGAFMRANQFLIQQVSALPPVDQTLGVPFGLLSPVLPINTPAGPISGESNAEFLFASLNSTANEGALFGEVTRRLGAHWELTGGVRLFRTHLSSDDVFRGNETPLVSRGTEVNEVRDQNTVSAKGVNPKFSVRYVLNRNIQTYVLASKGFQFGGVQINPPSVAFESLANQNGSTGFVPYKSSTLWNYEWGFRTQWFQNLLQFDTTLFYLSWKDLQLTKAVREANAVGFNIITNVGHAHSDGIEAAFKVIPFSGLTLSSSAAWINAVTDVPLENADGTVTPPLTRLPGTPRFAFSNVLSYERNVSFLGAWNPGVNLTFTHTGRSFNDLEMSGKQGGYETLDARIHLLRSDSRFQPDLSLNLNNALDKRGVATIGTAQGERSTIFFLIPPRTVLLNLAIRY